MSEERQEIYSKKMQDFYFNLLPRGWKNRFTSEQLKFFIAQNLNACACMEKNNLKITGYLITGRRLILIVRCKEGELSLVMDSFYKHVRYELRKRWQEDLYHKEIEYENDNQEIFREYRLYDDILAKLITGKKIRQKYYSPYVAQLENYISRSSYSSALDYSGGKGPVILEWQREEGCSLGLA